MHISGVVAAFTTEFGGIANRIHNVELVAHLVDGTLIAPDATSSFNETTGDRNAAKGFLEAPVIVNGELTTGLGGGSPRNVPRTISPDVYHPLNGNAIYVFALPEKAR